MSSTGSRVAGISAAIIAIALTCATAILFYAAERKWTETVSTAPWLAAAKPDISISSWLTLSFRSKAEIARMGAPLAARNLAEVSLDISAVDGNPIDQVKRLITVSNNLSTACSNSDIDTIRDICAAKSLSARFQRFDETFKSVPILAADYYLEFLNRLTTLKRLSRFAATLCNYDAGSVSVNLATDFDDYDAIEDERADAQLAAGECNKLFDRKLRRPPTITVNATGDAVIASQLRGISAFRSIWGNRTPAWSDQIAFDMDKTEVRRSFRNPGLCHGRSGSDCGLAKVVDPAHYAKALNESLVTEQRFASYPPGSLFRFKIGAVLAGTATRDELGANIVEVETGSVAEAAGLRGGDTIVSAGGRPIFSAADVIAAVNVLGDQHGHTRPLQIEFLRGGTLFTQEIAISYNKAFFDAAGWNFFNTTIVHFFDAITLGLAKYTDCAVLRPIGHWATGTQSSFSHQDCIAQWRRDLPILRELYWREFQIGAFIADLISPLNWVVGRFIGPSLFGVTRFGAIVRQAAIASAAHAIQGMASITPGETVEATIDRVSRELPMALARHFIVDTKWR